VAGHKRVALVTGGSRGLGREIALRLGQNGACIAFAYRTNKVAAQRVQAMLKSHGADVLVV
jgi:3-oxoacyl-[acyl-carrier protein] reductase